MVTFLNACFVLSIPASAISLIWLPWYTLVFGFLVAFFLFRLTRAKMVQVAWLELSGKGKLSQESAEGFYNILVKNDILWSTEIFPIQKLFMMSLNKKYGFEDDENDF